MTNTSRRATGVLANLHSAWTRWLATPEGSTPVAVLPPDGDRWDRIALACSSITVAGKELQRALDDADTSEVSVNCAHLRTAAEALLQLLDNPTTPPPRTRLHLVEDTPPTRSSDDT